MASHDPDEQIAKVIAEPYAFAVLLWPAIVGAWLLTAQDQLPMWRYGLYVWLAIMHLATYGSKRGVGFGNLMLFNSGVVAAACYTYPSLWTLAWLPLLLIGLYAAQRVRLRAEPQVSESGPLGATGT